MHPTLTSDRVLAVIRAATEDVFQTMLMVPIEPEPSFHEQAASQSFDGVIAFVGLAGPWAGSGRIACSPALACRISGALLSCEFAAVTEEVLDAIGEITNMIVGGIKTALEEELGPMGLSIPTVIFGRNYQTRASGATNWIVAPYRCESESFDVRLCLVPQARVAPHRLETTGSLV